jgi:hypothetical protein
MQELGLTPAQAQPTEPKETNDEIDESEAQWATA